MPNTLITAVTVLWLALLADATELRAETVTDPNLGFTLKLPTEFASRPDLIGATPDIVHAFQFGKAKEGEIPVLLFIEKMGGVIGPKHLDKRDMPSGFSGDLFLTTWRGFEVDGFEVRESVNGIDAVTYNVQIPLKGEAIQIKLFGPTDRRELLQPVLRNVLDGLDGETNWLSSAAPTPVARSEIFGTVLVGVGIGAVIFGLVVLWLVSLRTPKGTVLAIAIVLYVLSWQIGDIRIREIRMLSSCMRILGFAGGILGVVDLVRSQKPKFAIEEVAESEQR